MRGNKYKLPETVQIVIDGLNPLRPKPTNKVFHVTELQMPPYARNLLREHDVEVDYSDSLISCQGDALHEAYQKYLSEKGYICEVSFSKEIAGVELTGTLDAYDPKTKTLISLKQTSVWGPSYKVFDYTAQENCYKWFLKEPVENIRVDIWYRNWQLKQAGYSHEYPKVPFEVMDIPIWSTEKTEQYIKDQLEYLLMSKDRCTREEKWQKYSVMKNKNKTPARNCPTEVECENWIRDYERKNPAKKDKFRIEDTEPTNCLHYCPARSVCGFARSL